MIESMIERLLAEAGEEADGKAFCETETEKSKTKQHELTQSADMHQVRLRRFGQCWEDSQPACHAIL